jgi:hypothetical protein
VKLLKRQYRDATLRRQPGRGKPGRVALSDHLGKENAIMPASTGRKPGHGGDAQPQVVERITVALIPKAGADLQALQDRTNLSKTDITNRAITLYEFIDAQQRAGRDLLIRDSETGETQTVLIL